MKGSLFVIILAMISQTCYGTKDSNFNFMCSNLTMHEVANRLWTASTNTTCLGKEFQSTIINEANKLCPNDPRLFVLNIQTLWATFVYSNYQHPTLTASRVLEDVLNLQLNPCLTNAQYNSALENYGRYIWKASEFMTDSSLRVAGCSVKEKKPLCVESLPSGDAVNRFLKTKDCSDPLVKIIKRLNSSDDPKDRTIALASAALSGGPLVQLCGQVGKTDEFLNVLRLNACNIQIPPKMCVHRKHEMKKLVDVAAPVVMKNLECLMKK